MRAYSFDEFLHESNDEEIQIIFNPIDAREEREAKKLCKKYKVSCEPYGSGGQSGDYYVIGKKLDVWNFLVDLIGDEMEVIDQFSEFDMDMLDY